MARRITVLKKTREDSETIEFEAALWLDIPSARRFDYAKPAGWTSAITSTTAGVQVTNTENTDLLNGTLYEVVMRLSVRKRKDDGTLRSGAELLIEAKRVMTQARADLQATEDARSELSRYGTTWDNTPAPNGTWTDRTVA